jgi:hypothetical protein
MKWLAKASIRSLLIVVLVGCGSEEKPTMPEPPLPTGPWVLTHAGTAFAFYLPPGMEHVPLEGVDSFVGRYERAAMRVEFDYGWYSNPLTGPAERVEETVIDGRQCRMVWWTYDMPPDALPYLVGVHFADVGDGENLLTMWARCDSEALRVDGERVLRSIDFPDSVAAQEEPSPRLTSSHGDQGRERERSLVFEAPKSRDGLGLSRLNSPFVSRSGIA